MGDPAGFAPQGSKCKPCGERKNFPDRQSLCRSLGGGKGEQGRECFDAGVGSSHFFDLFRKNLSILQDKLHDK